VRAPSRAFAIGALAFTLAIISARLALAQREWFYGDDFFFLTWVRDPHWTWRETLMPTSARMIAAYRPLGLDGYFLANFALFGWNAFGYYATGLMLQALTGYAVFRIARHYGLEWRVAAATGLLVLAAKPSSTATYEIADHNYICAAAATTFAVAWFLDHLRSGRARERWASCAMLAVAVLSNEISVGMPLVAFIASLFAYTGPLLERARKSVLSLAPHLVVIILFVDFRLSGIPTRQAGWFYDLDVSLDVASNTRGNLEYVMGGKLEFYVALALVAAVAALHWWRRRRGTPFEINSAGVQIALISSVWLAAIVLPLSVLALPATRFALVLLPAAALVLGATSESLLPMLRPAWRTPALLLALALLTPFQGMRERLERPKGAAYREAHAVATRALQENTSSSCVTVVCNGPGLANASQCARFRDGALKGQLWSSVDPRRYLAVEFSESGSEAFLERVRNVHDCVRFYLQRDLSVSTEPPSNALHASLSSARRPEN
jgi:hypothetical protein